MSSASSRRGTCAGILSIAGFATTGRATAPSPPARTVVELFTSQGCASCPPADQLLQTLRRRSDLLPLSLHVPYWDRLGWSDPFALKAAELRQKNYRKGLGARTIYTPQLVIQGAASVVGSDHKAIEAALRSAPATQGSARLVVDRSPQPRLRCAIDLPEALLPAEAWLLAVDREAASTPTGGENQGRALQHFNVVRSIVELESVTESVSRLSLDLASELQRDFLVLLVHGPRATAGLAPIVASATWDFQAPAG